LAEEKKKPEISKEDRCAIAVDVALETILGECGGSKELVMKHIGELLGIDGNPISAKCEYVLERGTPAEVCKDFREIRRWVLCRAWELMETEGLRFRDAISRAWIEAKEKCAAHGVYL